ncbi:MAG: hypothetical protein R6X25_12900, partial [Candidatus Krumholzibacteriia bacterium]
MAAIIVTGAVLLGVGACGDEQAERRPDDRVGSEDAAPPSGDVADLSSSSRQTPAEEIGGDQPRLLRGTVVQEARGLVFTPCGSDDRFLLADRTTLGLAGLVARAAGDDRPVYLEFMGETGPGPAGDGLPGVAGVMLVSHLLFVAFGESRGCEEDLAGVEMVARGQEPGWQVEIRKDSAVLRTAEQPDGVRFSELTASHAGGGRV